MTWEAWYTLGVIALLIVALVSNRMGVDTAMVGALTLIMVPGIIDVHTAVKGFADPSVLMIAALFVVAAGLTETGAMEMVAQHVLGRPKDLVGTHVRLMLPVAVLSSFMNNTPIVAMYLPIVTDWSRKLGISPSKLFMPLSFAAIMGGSCTLIGTSTNLAVNNLYLTYFEDHGEMLAQSFGLTTPSVTKQFWWIAVVGVPAAVLGIVFIVLFSRWLLPARKPAALDMDKGRRYTTQVIVEEESVLAGRTIEDAGLRNLPGLYLYEIQRGEEMLTAVSPEEILHEGDVLVFAGVVESVVDLLKIRGLAPATDQVEKVEGRTTIVEAVVSHNSPLARKTVRQSLFRTRYNAAIIAVHRGGDRVRKRIGDIVLQPGDTLLLATHSGFVQAYRNSEQFYLVSNVDGARRVRHDRAYLSLAIMGLLVLLLTVPLSPIIARLNATLGTAIPDYNIHPLAAGFLCAMLMVVTRCCTGTIARRSISFQILICIGAAIGIGKALDYTGAASAIAHAVFDPLKGFGPHVVLFGFALLTSVFSQLITNKGAAILMFPIAMHVALSLEVSPEPFVVTLMVSAACSFMTPVGFVTNLMVYGPGGYRFTDFMRLGVPLTLIVATTATVISPFAFPFNP